MSGSREFIYALIPSVYALNEDSISTKNIYKFIKELSELPFYEGLIFNSESKATSLILEINQEILEDKSRYLVLRNIEKHVARIEG